MSDEPKSSDVKNSKRRGKSTNRSTLQNNKQGADSARSDSMNGSNNDSTSKNSSTSSSAKRGRAVKKDGDSLLVDSTNLNHGANQNNDVTLSNISQSKANDLDIDKADIDKSGVMKFADHLELNKIVASILVAGIIILISSIIADNIYKPVLNLSDRGYRVEIAGSTDENNNEAGASGAAGNAIPVDVNALMAKASAENGKKIAAKCLSCHTFGKGMEHRVGPNLWNVFGSKKASKQDYVYSRAFASLSGVWDANDLFHFLKKPAKFVPGTKMSFVGISKDSDVADVIAYLETLVDN